VNINMLRDTDSDAGFYASACGYDSTWRAAMLYRSVDAGASYQAISAFTAPAVIGTLLDVLGDFGGGNVPDEINSFAVQLTSGTLSSVSYAGLLAGAQVAVVGAEILCFRTASLNLDGSYTVSGLLRGRRGSEYAMATHGAGERFVLASSATFKRILAETADLGMARLYKAVTDGSTLASAVAQSFTNVGAGLKPYAPVQLGGGRNAAGDLTLNWVRRNRISGEWRDSVDVPMSEASEAYEVEIWNSTRSTLKRTFTGLSSPTASYSAADQTTDFGSQQAVIQVSVYQLSAIVGRGYETQASV
jgi:hypothetical protein